MKAKIFFADERVRDSFAALKASRRNEEQELAARIRGERWGDYHGDHHSGCGSTFSKHR